MTCAASAAVDHRRQPVQVLLGVVGLRRVDSSRAVRVLHDRQLRTADTVEHICGAPEGTGEQSYGSKHSQDVHAVTIMTAMSSRKG